MHVFVRFARLVIVTPWIRLRIRRNFQKNARQLQCDCFYSKMAKGRVTLLIYVFEKKNWPVLYPTDRPPVIEEANVNVFKEINPNGFENSSSVPRL